MFYDQDFSAEDRAKESKQNQTKEVRSNNKHIALHGWEDDDMDSVKVLRKTMWIIVFNHITVLLISEPPVWFLFVN